MINEENKKKDLAFAFQLKEEKKYNESIEKFKQILNEYGEDPSVILMIALLLQIEVKDPNSALHYALQSVQLIPNSEKASLNLVHCLIHLDRKDESEQEISRFINTGSRLELYLTLFEENNLSTEDFKHK